MPIDPHSPTGTVLKGLKRGFGKAHSLSYRWSGGRVGARVMGGPVLLLTTIGRRTGQPRTVPLLYLEKDGTYVVSASNAGHWEPAWFLNLQANPNVGIHVGGQVLVAQARVTDGEERAALWAEMAAINPTFERYPTNRGCDIPMVVLEPIGG